MPAPAREAQTFPQGPSWLAPWLRSDKSHACQLPAALSARETARPGKPGRRTENQPHKMLKKARVGGARPGASRGRAPYRRRPGRTSRDLRSRDRPPGRPPPPLSPGAQDRLCAAGRSGRGPPRSRRRLRRVVRLPAARPPRARSPAGARRALYRLLPGKSSCHFLPNCLRLVPPQPAWPGRCRPCPAAAAGPPDRGCSSAGSSALPAASRAQALGAAAACRASQAARAAAAAAAAATAGSSGGRVQCAQPPVERGVGRGSRRAAGGLEGVLRAEPRAARHARAWEARNAGSGPGPGRAATTARPRARTGRPRLDESWPRGLDVASGLLGVLVVCVLGGLKKPSLPVACWAAGTGEPCECCLSRF